MRTLALFSLFLTLTSHAAIDGKNPVSRYFRQVPIEKAHLVLGETQDEKISSLSLNILVWNVKKGSCETFASEFKKYGEGKDFLLIQEAYTASFFSDILLAFQNYQWDLGISFTYRLYDNNGTGNMIGSSVKPNWVLVEHTPDLEPVTNTPKTTTFAKYSLANRDDKLLMISMHGINFADDKAYTHHLAQVTDEIKNHQGPVILAGDFNTRTKERYRQILKTFTRDIDLHEVKFLNGEIRMTAVGTKNYLDHAFVRGFKVKEAEVHESDGSDHKPMTLNLDFL